MDRWFADDAPCDRFPVFTRGNIGEVFPEVVLPLAWDVVAPQYEAGWRRAFRTFGALLDRDLGDTPMGILGCYGGYAYLNASYLRVFGVRTPGLSVEELDRQFFGESDAPPYVAQRGDRSPVASLRIARTLVRTLRARSLPALEADKALVAAHLAAQPDLAPASDAVLLDAMHGFLPPLGALFERHILITFQAMIGRGLLAQICGDVLGDPGRVNQLLVGIGEVESAEPARAMWDLSRLDAGSSAYDEGLAQFLERFGSRGPNEWDPASRTWGIDPTLVERAVDRMRGAGADKDPRSQQQRLAQARAAEVAALRARLPRRTRIKFDLALRSATVFSQGRERSKTTIVRMNHGLRVLQYELARRGRDRGGPADLIEFFYLRGTEVAPYLADPPAMVATLADRRSLGEVLHQRVPPFVFDRVQPAPSTWASRDAAAAPSRDRELSGIAGCPGVARGRARIVRSPWEPGDLGPGDVLVAPITDPSWTPLFVPVEGVIVEVGAEMSHAVIVSRELGIPAVVSVTGATSRIPDGAMVEVDGNRGTVRILDG